MNVLTEIKPVNGRLKKQRHSQNLSSGQDQSMDSGNDRNLRKKRKLKEIVAVEFSEEEKSIESQPTQVG